MVRQIILEGGLYREVETQVIREARLEDVMPHISSGPHLTMPMMPRTALFWDWDESNARAKTFKVICEIAAGLKTIVKSNRRYRLSMPWTYFYFQAKTSGGPQGTEWQLGDYRVFHAQYQVNSMTAPMITALLPNVYEDGRICFGSTAARANAPLAERIDTLVNQWYATQFNNDVIGSREHARPYGNPPTWREWVDASAQDPLSFINWPEWSNTRLRRWTVEGLFGANLTRTDPILITDAIPPIPEPATIGRVDEWVEGLTASQRLRVLTAIENRRTQDPTSVMATPAPARTRATTTRTVVVPEDDGGEPL